jgi:dTDP-4-amino-4,6-dideoxygalactose transaminase
MDKLKQFLTEYYEGQSCEIFARGSTGLYVLFKTLYEIKGAKEIIIPAICCETIPIAAIYAGMKPVIADVDIDNLCLSYESVLRKISKDTVAIVLVYIFGNIFDSAPFENLKATSDIVLIEDVAQAAGGYDSGQRVGQRFDFTLLSFADEKIIKGQGGAIIQRNPQYKDALQPASAALPPSPQQRILQQKQSSLRNLVHSLYDLSRTDHSIDISGTFLAMLPYYKDVIVRQKPVTHADRIISQFQKISNEQEQRYKKYAYYQQHIKNDLLEPIEFAPGTMCWRLPMLVKDPVNTFYITALLRKNGILASNHYFPLDKLLDNAQNPNSANVGARILNLWVDDLVSMDQMQKTVELLNAYSPVM